MNKLDLKIVRLALAGAINKRAVNLLALFYILAGAGSAITVFVMIERMPIAVETLCVVGNTIAGLLGLYFGTVRKKFTDVENRYFDDLVAANIWSLILNGLVFAITASILLDAFDAGWLLLASILRTIDGAILVIIAKLLPPEWFEIFKMRK